jgi:quercetin dioxygenase-like cupin family protein
MNPKVKIGCVANLFSRQMHFAKAGDTEQGHKHVFDHLTLLAKGSLRVTVNGKVTEFTAPHMIYIRAEFNHELVALEDETVAYCIHALRNGDDVSDIIAPEMIPEGVDARTIAKPVVCADFS